MAWKSHLLFRGQLNWFNCQWLFLVFLGKICVGWTIVLKLLVSVYSMYCGDFWALTNFWLLLTWSCFDLNSSTNTSFAQPSGLSLSQDLSKIYIADSESSSIRAVDLKTGGSQLLAGGDPMFSDNLFKFGDQDGIGSDVLLQHPLGVLCGNDGEIYIADSYNHKVENSDPVTFDLSWLWYAIYLIENTDSVI